MSKINEELQQEVSAEDFTELLDSTYPLLQKLRELCPGTFKHSQALSSIVEGVAIALDLDVTAMKIAAMYHDIGKTINPKYFVENQLGEETDPHEKLDTWISSQLISRHVSDTVMLLVSDKKFPRKIIEMVSQHHGSTVIRFFFNKSNTDIDDHYRYKCDRPKNVESAVLMICDHIEAKSKSLFQSDNFNPIEIIESTINGLLDDGQLDNVYMRLGDLKRIKEALVKELEGVYHKRPEYTNNEKGKNKKEKINDTI